MSVMTIFYLLKETKMVSNFHGWVVVLFFMGITIGIIIGMIKEIYESYQKVNALKAQTVVITKIEYNDIFNK